MANSTTPRLGVPTQHAPERLYSFDRALDNGTSRGLIRAYWLGSVVCMGAFLFGYDSGIVGGVLTLAFFQRDFGYGKQDQTRTSALSVGLQQLGAFWGAFWFGPLLNSMGIFTSYWIDYGASFMKDEPTSQWQAPIGLQLVPAALLGGGVLTLKESARWLTGKGQHQETFDGLSWIRGDASQSAIDEMNEIRLGVGPEAEETKGFEFKELLRGDYFRRVFAAFCIMAAQQATGATAFAYFGPQYFTLLVGAGRRALMLTTIFGTVKVSASWSAAMAVCQIATAVVVRARPAPDDGAVTSSGIMTVALIYIFVIIYNISWGPMLWPYMSE
ncbi:hypothetical protein BKA56DRAFT_678048 [Ilyonectria sp. MPI-CAGE-AT-0026]|nr:hypothetical protein BKA56DRAFT_678048 [Ilyonectria sp. MPI-CAGE-AT-0026]